MLIFKVFLKFQSKYRRSIGKHFNDLAVYNFHWLQGTSQFFFPIQSLHLLVILITTGTNPGPCLHVSKESQDTGKGNVELLSPMSLWKKYGGRCCLCE